MICQVLDITRTISRVGQGLPTGIDRVERAYIKAFLERFLNAVFLVKLSQTYVLVNAQVMQKFVDADFGQSLRKRAGFNDLIRLKLPILQRRARSFLRDNGDQQFSINGVKDILLHYFPDGFEYTNVGHSNLNTNFLSQLKAAGCSHIRIMIHDMIPLDFPQYCKDKIPEKFRIKMQSVAAVADTVICNSQYTKSRVQNYFDNWSCKASYTVAHLGTENIFKPINTRKSSPASFIVLGTIESRKNHAFLLDIWEDFSQRVPENKIPVLYIVGKRGWKNDAFFERLDQSPLLGKKIIEQNKLTDIELNLLMGSASGLLFPSFVEGYGLPALEAIAAGIPVICSDIPVFKELLGPNAHILSVDDSVKWTQQILDIADNSLKNSTPGIKNTDNTIISTWAAHFCHIFRE